MQVKSVTPRFSGQVTFKRVTPEQYKIIREMVEGCYSKEEGVSLLPDETPSKPCKVVCDVQHPLKGLGRAFQEKLCSLALDLGIDFCCKSDKPVPTEESKVILPFVGKWL